MTTLEKRALALATDVKGEIDEEDDGGEGTGLRTTSLLLKPVRAEELRRTVRKVLDARPLAA